ncbi:MAG: hypothetical protein H0Z37_00715 [Firmicutes bacterium]|nr:hypothetical protein [Bacillota bacterium]
MKIRSLLALAAVLALASVGFAEADERMLEDPKASGVPAPTYQYDAENNVWEAASLARSFNVISEELGSLTTSCNGPCLELPFANHISVGQWGQLTLSSNYKYWEVLKPGKYASDSVRITVASNSDVMLKVWIPDAEDQFVDDLPGYPDDHGYTTTIAKWAYISDGYVSPTTPPNPGESWGRGTIDETNGALYEKSITHSSDLHYGQEFTLWEMIEVGNSNSVSDYFSVGSVRLALQNLAEWQDPEDGGFLEE